MYTVCKEIPGRAGHDFSVWNNYFEKKKKKGASEGTTIIHISKCNLANYFM